MSKRHANAGLLAAEELYRAIEYSEQIARINGEVEHHIAARSYQTNLAAKAADGYAEVVDALSGTEQLQKLLRQCAAALEPFAKAADAVDNMDPEAPDEMAALRPSFDYWTRHVGRDNDEIVERDSVRLSDLRRARRLAQLIATEIGDAEM